jgi:hypothetical protein
MGVVSILLADGARDDGLGHSSFAILVHSSPFASASITGSSGSVRSYCELSEIGIVVIDRPDRVGLIFLDSLVSILHRQHLITD